MSNPLRVGVIGAGLAAGKHLGGYRLIGQHARVVAISDVDENAARRRSREAGIESVYTDPLRMIREAPIDAVDICTINSEHAALAIAAADAGNHVLVEKPMATTLSDCRAMIDAASRAGVKLMVAMNQRFKGNYRAARRAIAHGEIGAVRAARMSAIMDVSAVPEGRWVFDGRRAGGGVLVSYAVSRIDLLRWLVGGVNRVFAICRTGDKRFTNGAEDHAAAMLEFDNGAVAELFASFLPTQLPDGESFTIIGDGGTIHAPGATVRSNEPVALATGGSGRFLPLDPDRGDLPTDDMFANTIAHFAECCRSGAEPMCSGADGIRTMRVVMAAYESAASGQAVDLSRWPSPSSI